MPRYAFPVSKSKVLAATVTIADSQPQVAGKPVRSKHTALGARVTLAQAINIAPGKAH